MNGVPPHSEEAERAVLGAVLIDNGALPLALDAITEVDFYREGHKLAFAAMVSLFKRDTPIDLVTLSEALKQEDQLTRAGGAAYLAQVLGDVPTSVNVGHYAQIVADKSALRRMLTASMEIQAEVMEEAGDADDIISNAERLVLGVSGGTESATCGSVSDLVSVAVNAIEDAHSPDHTPDGVEPPVVAMRAYIKALAPGGMYTLAGQTGKGKTALAIDFARHAAVNDKKAVLFFTLEMPKEQIAHRLLCSQANVQAWAAGNGKLHDDDWPKLINAAAKLAETKIEIEDRGSLTITQAKAKARKAKKKMGALDLIVVDYLQLMAGDTKTDNRQIEVSTISRGLKGLARDMGVPVLALSQFNREVDKRPGPPRLSDLRECLPLTEWIYTPRGPVNLKTRPSEIVTTERSGRSAISECEFIEKKYSRVYRIDTQYGTVSATPRHLILTGTGWKRARDIVPGKDCVACPRKIPHENRGYIPHGRLLGWMIGNGFLSGTPGLIYRKELDADVRAAVAEFGVSVRPTKAQKSDNVINSYLSRGLETGCLPNPLMTWVRSLGMEGKICYDKEVPAQYLGSDEATHIELLQGLWESDGTVTGGVAKYATVSELLARQVKWLLHTIGVKSTVRFYDNIWEVHCSRADNDTMRKVCCHPGRFGELKMPSERYIDPAPEIFVALMDELVHDVRFQKRDNGDYKQTPKNRVLSVLERHPISTIKESPYISMENMSWARVYSSEISQKEVRVGDLSVPMTHNFIANGLVVHNSGSIEQDSDAVIFIYKPTGDGDQDARGGVHDIIFAKHRHGPTGKVQAYFHAEICSFRDIERHEHWTP